MPGRTRFATAESIAPEPLAANVEHVVVGAEDLRQALEHAGVQLHAGRRAVVEHRLGHLGEHARRHGRRPGGHEDLLDEGLLGHGGAVRVARGGAQPCAKSWSSIQDIIERSFLPSTSTWWPACSARMRSKFS